MNIRELKKHISGKMVNIPNWIDTTSSLHHLIWQSGIQSINAELLKLITNSILTEKAVFKIYTNITDLLDNMSEITSVELQLKVIAYFSKMLLYLEDITIEYEFYESTANIKRFTDIYYVITPIK
jgi:uncharacterized protein YerC